MYYLYLLHSRHTGRNYIGVTTNIERRLSEHNRGMTSSTKPFRPWVIAYTEEYHVKSDAYKREWYLKHPQGYLARKKIQDTIK